MRKSGITANMYDLGRLIDEIAVGDVGIPDFQRDFDWSEADVRALLVTVFAGWPAGSLLLLDSDKNFFSLRPFEAGPALAQDPRYAVLDGQQRLTSLYQALTGCGENVFAIKWDQPEDIDLEEIIVSYRKSIWETRYSQIDQQAAHKLIPISSLKDATTFFEWRDEISEFIGGNDGQITRSAITSLYKRQLSKIHNYEFPAVVLEDSLDPAAIARIFERVNRTGLKLNTFDLMVARTFDPAFNLREKWLEARETYAALSRFLQDDGMPLLQAISLRNSSDLRQSAVLQLKREIVRRDWGQAAKGANAALAFLEEECGAFRAEYLPYSNIIAPIAALSMANELNNKRETIRKWFWQSAFSSSFDAAANTRLVAHYKAIMAGEVHKLSSSGKFIEFDHITRKSDRAFWSGVVCALFNLVRLEHTGLPDYAPDELEASLLYSKAEVENRFGANQDYLSVTNTILVPGKHASIIRKLDSDHSLVYAQKNGFAQLIAAQMHGVYPRNWEQFHDERLNWFREFIKENTMFPGEIQEIEFE